MILVTGATGGFGKAAIECLLEKGIPSTRVAALVRDPETAVDLAGKGIAVRKGDYDKPDQLVAAFSGVEKLLFVSGSDIMNRSRQHENVVQAAKKAGVKHVVYTSFLGKNQTKSSPLWMVAQSHLQTEAWLKESGMAFTILRNTLYMDFVPAFLGEQMLETGVIYLPAGSGKVGAVLRAEMAEAAANVLAGANHEGKTYQFTHSEAFSYTELARYLSELTSRPVNYVSPTAEAYVDTLAGYGVPPHVIGIFSGFAVAQANGELETVSNDLTQLLGRKPTTIQVFLRQVYAPVNNA